MITDDRIHDLAARLMTVPGVQAVTLGGSRARGTHHAGSDVDLGLYYSPRTLDLVALQDAITELSATEAPLAGPGSWGPWVNGGAWLRVDGTAVDVILRDLTRVREQCDRAVSGEFAFHSQPGHPLGFLDVSYAGEVAHGRLLADPDGLLAGLKSRLEPYPERLRRALIDHLWQADFLTGSARKALPRSDLAYLTLCCSTALMLCAHAWHAHAGVWAINEKGLVPDTATLPFDTGGFPARAADALARLATTPADGLAATSDLVAETRKTLEYPVDGSITGDLDRLGSVNGNRIRAAHPPIEAPPAPGAGLRPSRP